MKLTIDDIGAGGDGIARGDGIAYFVPGALPGETVTAEPLDAPRKGVQRARLVAIENASPARISPPCPHFGACGGCQLQHMDSGYYQRFKEDAIVRRLTQAGLAPVRMDAPVCVPAGTRRRAAFTARRNDAGGVDVGFHQAGSGNVQPVNDCLLLTPRLQGVKDALHEFLPGILFDRTPVSVFVQQADSGVEMVITGAPSLKTMPDKKTLARLAQMADGIGLARLGARVREFAPVRLLAEGGRMVKTFGPLAVQLPFAAFLQPSAEGEQALTSSVANYAGPKARRIMDLFCGSGTFTGALAAQASRLDAYDSDRDAAAALQAALKTYGKGQAHARNLFLTPLNAHDVSGADLVVADPPRAGMDAQAAELALSAVPRIVYVSCNPVTFMRDAALLTGGGYTFSALRMVDQFQWSSHTELVACFDK